MASTGIKVPLSPCFSKIEPERFDREERGRSAKDHRGQGSHPDPMQPTELQLPGRGILQPLLAVVFKLDFFNQFFDRSIGEQTTGDGFNSLDGVFVL